jgi:Invasion associated locus B (IalB) protein
MIRPSRLLFAAVAAAMSATAASADDATLLGTSKDWQALTMGSGSSKICYAMAKPRSSDPRKIKRDPIFFLVTDWPGRKTRSEPSANPGYQYKDGSTVTAQVGSDKFEFFTQNDGKAGTAWIRKRADEVRMVEAMKAGQELIVTGISKRGTMTRDTYSLAGLADALDAIHKACGM